MPSFKIRPVSKERLTTLIDVPFMRQVAGVQSHMSASLLRCSSVVAAFVVVPGTGSARAR
eukprot:4831625-Pyramimonas_sp.AAC.1